MGFRGIVITVGCFALLACGDDQPTPQHDAPPPATADIVALGSDNAAITTISFGDLALGRVVAATMHLTNNGQGDSAAIALAIGGTDANDFSLDNTLTTCSGMVLTAGASCEIALRFQPIDNGDRLGTLTIVTGASQPISLSLAGHAFTAALHFVPPTVPLGTLEVGHSSQASAQLVNDGTEDAPIDSITVSDTAYTVGINTCGTSLAPGAACDISLQFVANDVMAHDATLTVRSDSVNYDAALTGQGAMRVTVTTTGTGAGVVTSAPALIDCGVTCTGLFTTDIVLTATPMTGSAFTGWSIPACGSSTTCAVPLSVNAATVSAGFTLSGSASLQLNFVGDAVGEVRVRKLDAPVTTLAYCYASCTVPIEPGEHIDLLAASPSTYGGYSGGCVDSSAACALTAPTGTTTVNVSFTRDAAEQWTRLPFDSETAVAVAFDGSGNIIVATTPYATASTGHLTKISSAGVTTWTRTLAVRAIATGPADTIYVVSGSNLMKMDSTSADLWSSPLDANSSTFDSSEPDHCLVVSGDGSVVVHGAGVTRWDTNGTQLWSIAVPSYNGIAVDAAGIIYVGVTNGDGTAARRYQSADGTELTPRIDQAGPMYDGRFAIDSDQHFLSSTSGHGEVFLTRINLGTMVQDYSQLFTNNQAGSVPNGVATSGLGRLLWWYYVTDPTTTGTYRTLVLQNDGTSLWSLDRTLYGSTFGKLGPALKTAAISASGQVVVVGVYHGLTYDGSLIQTYQP